MRGDLRASPPQLFGRGGDRPYRPHGVGAYAGRPPHMSNFVKSPITLLTGDGTPAYGWAVYLGGV